MGNTASTKKQTHSPITDADSPSVDYMTAPEDALSVPGSTLSMTPMNVSSLKLDNVDGIPADSQKGEESTHFDKWQLHCGHPDKYGCDEDNRTFYFENSTIIMRQQERIKYFEVEILDHWGNDTGESILSADTQFFGFVTKEFKPTPTVTKENSLANSEHAWCFGRYSAREGLTIHHKNPDGNINGNPQNPYPCWGATSVLEGSYHTWQVGDVFQCFWDKHNGEIWFGMNGEWRYMKGKAFEGLRKSGLKLYPAICFNNGTIRVNVNDKDLLYEKGPSDADRKFVGTKLPAVVIPAFGKVKDDEADLEDKVIPENFKDSEEEEVEAKEEDTKAEDSEKKRNPEKEEEKPPGEFDFDKTPDDNTWGITFWASKDERQGVILVDKVDWRKEAWAKGIRRNMMVTRVNEEEVTMENYMDLAKRLDFSDGNPDDVTIHVQDEIPLKEPVRFYRSQCNTRSLTEIHQRIHVRSLVIGYLQPNDEVHVILKKDWVDDADKESMKHYMRGLIGKKSDKPLLVSLTDNLVIKDKLFGEDTKHRLSHLRNAVYDPEKTREVFRGNEKHTWYCLTEPELAGWIKITRKEDIVLGHDVRGWITLHDYRSNLSFIKESKGSVDLSKWKADAFYRWRGPFEMLKRNDFDSGYYEAKIPSTQQLIFKDKNWMDPIRTLKQNEKFEIREIEVQTDFYPHGYLPHYDFEPGWYKLISASTTYDDAKMTTEKGSLNAGEVVKVKKIVKEKTKEQDGWMNMMGELEDGCFIKMHKDGEPRSVTVKPMPHKAWYGNNGQIKARLSNGFWILLKTSGEIYETALEEKMYELSKYSDEDMSTETITIPAGPYFEFVMTAPPDLDINESNDKDVEGGADVNEDDGKGAGADDSKKADDNKSKDAEDDENKDVSLVCRIESVEKDSPAWKAGLRAGQVVLKIGDDDLRCMENSVKSKSVHTILSSLGKSTETRTDDRSECPFECPFEPLEITVGSLKEPLEVKCPIEELEVSGREEPYKQGDKIKLMNIECVASDSNKKILYGMDEHGNRIDMTRLALEIMFDDFRTTKDPHWSVELKYVGSESIKDSHEGSGFLMRELHEIVEKHDGLASCYGKLFESANCQGFVVPNEIVRISEFKKYEGKQHGEYSKHVFGKTKKGWLLVQSPKIPEGSISPCSESSIQVLMNEEKQDFDLKQEDLEDKNIEDENIEDKNETKDPEVKNIEDNNIEDKNETKDPEVNHLEEIVGTWDTVGMDLGEINIRNDGTVSCGDKLMRLGKMQNPYHGHLMADFHYDAKEDRDFDSTEEARFETETEKYALKISGEAGVDHPRLTLWVDDKLDEDWKDIHCIWFQKKEEKEQEKEGKEQEKEEQDSKEKLVSLKLISYEDRGYTKQFECAKYRTIEAPISVAKRFVNLWKKVHKRQGSRGFLWINNRQGGATERKILTAFWVLRVGHSENSVAIQSFTMIRKEEKEEENQSNSWGVEIDEETKFITKVRPDSLADKAGMKVGWRIDHDEIPSKGSISLKFDDRRGFCATFKDTTIARMKPDDNSPIAKVFEKSSVFNVTEIVGEGYCKIEGQPTRFLGITQQSAEERLRNLQGYWKNDENQGLTIKGKVVEFDINGSENTLQVQGNQIIYENSCGSWYLQERIDGSILCKFRRDFWKKQKKGDNSWTRDNIWTKTKENEFFGNNHWIKGGFEEQDVVELWKASIYERDEKDKMKSFDNVEEAIEFVKNQDICCGCNTQLNKDSKCDVYRLYPGQMVDTKSSSRSNRCVLRLPKTPKMTLVYPPSTFYIKEKFLIPLMNECDANEVKIINKTEDYPGKTKPDQPRYFGDCNNYPIWLYSKFGKSILANPVEMFEKLGRARPSFEDDQTYYIKENKPSESTNNGWDCYEHHHLEFGSEQNPKLQKMLYPGTDCIIEEGFNTVVADEKTFLYYLKLEGYGWIRTSKEPTKYPCIYFNRVQDLKNLGELMIVGSYELSRQIKFTDGIFVVTKEQNETEPDGTTRKIPKKIGTIRILNRHTLEMTLTVGSGTFRGDFSKDGIWWLDGKVWHRVDDEKPEEKSKDCMDQWLHNSWHVAMTSMDRIRTRTVIMDDYGNYGYFVDHDDNWYVVDMKTMTRIYKVRKPDEWYRMLDKVWKRETTGSTEDVAMIVSRNSTYYIQFYDGLVSNLHSANGHDARACTKSVKLGSEDEFIDEFNSFRISPNLEFAAAIGKVGGYHPVVWNLKKIEYGQFARVDDIEKPIFSDYYTTKFSPDSRFYIVTGYKRDEKNEYEDQIVVFDVKNDFKIKGKFSVVDLSDIIFSPKGSFVGFQGEARTKRNEHVSNVSQDYLTVMNTMKFTFDDGSEQDTESLLSVVIRTPPGTFRITDFSFSYDEAFLAVLFHSMKQDDNFIPSGMFQIYSTKNWQPLRQGRMILPIRVQFTPNRHMILGIAECSRKDTFESTLLELPENNRLHMFEYPDSMTATPRGFPSCINKNEEKIGMFTYRNARGIAMTNCKTGKTERLILDKDPDAASFDYSTVRLNDDGRFIAMVCSNGKILIFDVTKKPTDEGHRKELECSATKCDFTMRGEDYYLAAAGTNNFVKIWKRTTKESEWEPHEGARSLFLDRDITTIHFTNDGLFCAGQQTTAKVLRNYWEPPENHHIIDIPLRGFVSTSAYSEQFNLIAVGLKHSVFFINTQVWRILRKETTDADDGEEVKKDYGNTTVGKLQFSSDGSLLFYKVDGETTFLDVVTWEPFNSKSRKEFAYMSPYGDFLIETSRDQRNKCYSCEPFPDAAIASIMSDKQVATYPATFTFLISRHHDQSIQYPENVHEFWKASAFHAWIFPELFVQAVLSKLSTNDKNIKPKKDALKAIRNVLLSITQKEHWVDILNVADDCYTDVLLAIAKSSKDPKVGSILEEFINSITLLPIHSLDINNSTILWEDIKDDKLELHKYPLPINDEGKHIWTEHMGHERDDICAFVLPVKGFADILFLQELKKFSSLWRSQLFKSDVMGIVVELWEKEVRWDFRKELIQFILLLATYTFSAKKVMDWRYDLSSEMFYSICAYLSMINSLAFMTYESRQIWNMSYRYFRSQYNVLQTAVHVGVIVSYIWGHTVTGTSKKYRYPVVLSSVTALLMYILSFYYLKGFPQISWLVTVLLEISSEASYFFALLMIIVLGFTTAFFGLGMSENWWDSLFFTATMGVVGERETSEDDLIAPNVGRVMYFVMVFVLMIVCLNAIIAFMSDTYDKVQESMNMEIRFGRMALYLEFTEAWTDGRKEKASDKMKQWIHVLRPVKRVDIEWEGQTRYLTNFITQSVNPLKEAQKKQKKASEDSVKQMSKDMESLNKKTEKQIQAVKDCQEQSIKQLKEEMKGDRDKLEAQNKEMQSQIKNMNSQVKDMTSQVMEMNSQVKEMETDMKKEMDDLKSEFKEIKTMLLEIAEGLLNGNVHTPKE